MVQKVWPGLELGIDAYLKTTRDLLDDGQFGAAVVLNGFNYAEGQNTGVELKAVYTNGNLRAYANWAWAIQRATNIVTNQYLFGADEIAYIQNNWINTDHSQVWTGSGGISYLWNGTRFTTDVIYGSGFRAGDFNTDHVAPYASVNAGMSHEFYIPGWNPITARFDVVNVTDTSYAIRTGGGIGVFLPQYGPRRGYYFGLAQKFGPGANKPPPAPPAYVPVYLPGYRAADFQRRYPGGVDLDRLLPGRQRRPQHRQVQHRYALQRQSRQSAVRHQHLVQALQRRRRRPSRLQLAGGRGRGRPRDRRRLRSPAHDRCACLPGRDLQSGHHADGLRCAGARGA